MTTIYDKKPQEVIQKTAESLKKEIVMPGCAKFVKTGHAKQRPPEDQDWWYKRAASILRKIYSHGPIGTNKLKKKYGSKKNRGHKPEAYQESSGKIIRVILQQLEQKQLIKQEAKGVHKGRVIAPKGKSFLDKIK